MVGCLKLYEEEYMRIKTEMSGRKKNTDKDSKCQEELVEQIVKKVIAESNGKESFWKKGIGDWIGILAAIVPAIWFIFNINKNVEELQEQVESLTKEVSDISDFLFLDGGVKTQLRVINGELGLQAKVFDITEEKALTAMAELSQKNSNNVYVTSPFQEDTNIELEANGKPYSREDLIDEKILLAYQENGNEVYFLGQYNSNYNWDGYCVTNVYSSEGVLLSICESNFDNGRRENYKSFYYESDNEWIYSCRSYKNGATEEYSGISKVYEYMYYAEKKLTSDNISETDILFVDDFIDNSNVKMICYYSGKTSDGRYNDTTGNAYHVKYDEDGTVLTLYVGRFENGTYNDLTGTAWDIAYSEEYDMYVCNTGKFKNGGALKKSSHKINMEEINEIIAPYTFECELKWKDCFDEAESEISFGEGEDY